MAGNVIVTRRSSKDFRVDRGFRVVRVVRDLRDPKDTNDLNDFKNLSDLKETKAIMALEATQAQRDYQVNENAFGGLKNGASASRGPG